jgi:alpha-beta hydrolase superfamily lysophospholipase
LRTIPIADDGTLGVDDGRELVLFVHGMWLHSSSWREWTEEFDRAGYQHRSFRWPGELPTAAAWRAAGRAPSVSIGGLHHELAGLVHAFGSKPIVIGHGAGGLLAEILLANGAARAAISITPVPTGAATAPAALRFAVMPRTASWFAIRPGSVTPTTAHRRYRSKYPGAVTDYQVFLARRIPSPSRPAGDRSRTTAWTGSPGKASKGHPATKGASGRGPGARTPRRGLRHIRRRAPRPRR